MTGIFNLLITKDIDVLKNTLEGLIEVIKLNHNLMGKYLEELLKSTYQFFNLYRSDQDWTTKEELREVAGFSIEIWNTLCEEELSSKFRLMNSAATQDGQMIWQCLASIMLEGLKETGFDLEHDHTLEDDSDASFAIDCAQGLRFLS